MIFLIKYKEENEEEQNGTKETQTKNETNNVHQSSSCIKKIKINVKDKRSSDKINQVRKAEEEAPQSVPFSLQDEPRNQEVSEEQSKEPHENGSTNKEETEKKEENVKVETQEKEKNNNEKKDTFNSLFSSSNKEGGSLFSGSLFSNNLNKSSLFSSSAGSSLPNLFSNINSTPGPGLFSFSSTGNQNNFFNFSKKNESDEEGSDGEDEKEEKRSDSPEAYRPTTEKTNGPYNKKYVKLVESFFVYNRKDKKYLSKGDGYLSIEYTEEPKKNAVIVFRYRSK